MNFLKKFGQVVLKITQVAMGVGPLIQAAAPGSATAVSVVVAELQLLAGVIQQAEIFGQALSLPGAQKLTAATPAVAQMILQSSIMAGRQIADPVKFQAGCQQMAAGMADILSSLKDSDVAGENKA